MRLYEMAHSLGRSEPDGKLKAANRGLAASNSIWPGPKRGWREAHRCKNYM